MPVADILVSPVMRRANETKVIVPTEWHRHVLGRQIITVYNIPATNQDYWENTEKTFPDG